MNFKEYLCTSLVIVNLAISASSAPTQDNAFYDKKNKEVKVSFDQIETEVIKSSIVSPISINERIQALDFLILLSLSLGLFFVINAVDSNFLYRKRIIKHLKEQISSYTLNLLPSNEKKESKQKRLFHSGVHKFNQIIP